MEVVLKVLFLPVSMYLLPFDKLKVYLGKSLSKPDLDLAIVHWI